ncbi:MAG: polysaccharide biosynthesis protein [Hyphomicrobiaceae bacterium]
MLTDTAKLIGHAVTEMPRRKRRAILATLDFLLLLITVWALYSLRYTEFYLPDTVVEAAVMVAGPAITIVTFMLMRVYHLVARYLGPRGAVRMFGCVVGATAGWAALLLFIGQHGVPRTVLLGYAVIGSTVVIGLRLLASNMLKSVGIHVRKLGRVHDGIPVLIYGTGPLAVQLGREMRYSKTRILAGYVDASFSMIGRKIDGVKIHRPERITQLIESLNIEEIIIAVENQKPSERRALLGRLEPYRVRVRFVPGLEEMATGRLGLRQLRSVEGRDLLGREEIAPIPAVMGAATLDKSILVTGAGGSIGSQLTRHIVGLKPRRVVMLDHSEAALYLIEKEIREIASRPSIGKPPEIIAVLGSVQNEPLLNEVMTQNEIQTVFHAAAFKHVPIVEENPITGIQNNAFGTEFVARTAMAHGVERFVLVSTDKAVRPTSVMGASKRLAELILQDLAAQSTGTIFTAVRFGNVLDSSGSVIPLFRDQIVAGGPVTVTDPNITRYFMSIDEATSLVIQAAGMARGGEVFVLDMGTPVKIDDLARSMIRLMGLEVKSADSPHGDIEIVYTGLRPGEKLYEELICSEHNASGTIHPRIMTSHEPALDPAKLRREIELLRTAIANRRRTLALAALSRLVDDYKPSIELKEPNPAPSNIVAIR